MILLIVNLIFGEIKFSNSIITLEEVLTRLVCLVIVFVIMFPFFSIGALGAGDVKLILVTAMVMRKPLVFMLVVFLLAAAIAVFKILRAGSVKERVTYLFDYLKSLIRYQTVIPYVDPTLTGDGKISFSIHLSVPIFLGAIICLVIEKL